ncbi:MAG: thymidine kinase [Actinobacteria bacterium]|nr:thymidine kinase [Actinomycetota bacterium]
MAELVYFSGTMDSGKSTLALQTHHNHSSAGRRGLVFTRNDRAGKARISSRLGLETVAIEADDILDFYTFVEKEIAAGNKLDYLICDEVQFYQPIQIEQLAALVDDFEMDIFTFGITADFRTALFPGSKRLYELADRINVLQVEALCWCGKRATHNARLINGQMVTEGEQVVVGDTSPQAPFAVTYEVLCRKHHMKKMPSSFATKS